MKKTTFALVTLSFLSSTGWALAQSANVAPTPTVTFGSPPVWSTPITQQPKKIKKHRHTHTVPTPIPANTTSGKVGVGVADPRQLPAK